MCQAKIPGKQFMCCYTQQYKIQFSIVQSSLVQILLLRNAEHLAHPTLDYKTLLPLKKQNYIICGLKQHIKTIYVLLLSKQFFILSNILHKLCNKQQTIKSATIQMFILIKSYFFLFNPQTSSETLPNFNVSIYE